MAEVAGTLRVNLEVNEAVLSAIEELRDRVSILEEAHQITIDGILRERIESDAECAKLMRENARLQRELEAK